MSLAISLDGSVSFTSHARARMQQRGIRPDALEALFDLGRSCHLHSKGRELVYFGKKARKGLSDERVSRIYAVLGPDGKVITVGHRYRRVKGA